MKNPNLQWLLPNNQGYDSHNLLKKKEKEKEKKSAKSNTDNETQAKIRASRWTESSKEIVQVKFKEGRKKEKINENENR